MLPVFYAGASGPQYRQASPCPFSADKNNVILLGRNVVKVTLPFITILLIKIMVRQRLDRDTPPKF